MSARSTCSPGYAAGLHGYRRALAEGDIGTADGVAAWLAGQPHVAASARRRAGVRGDIDHFLTLGFLQAPLTVLHEAGHTGLVLVLDTSPRSCNGSDGPAGGRGACGNCLFLALDLDQVLHAAGLLLRWSQGWVEPVTPPPSPRHIVAQQLLALALQENTLGRKTWPEWWHGLAPMSADGEEVLRYLIDEGYLETDGDLAFIGPEAERRFGRRHFSDLMAVFTSAPEFVVLAGRDEIGSVGDDVLVADSGGAARVLLLAGRAWLVTHIDWKRRRCFVEATDLPGRAKWGGLGVGLSFEISRGMRGVLLGEDAAGVRLSRRAADVLAELRDHHGGHVTSGGTVIRRSVDGDLHWWTWAGSTANRTLQASLGDLVDQHQRIGDQALRLRHGDDLRTVAAAMTTVGRRPARHRPSTAVH
jgi:ATP-dependent Lhr-like helicase